MRCVVTGATGYIGGRLAPRLAAEGHEVRCVVRTPEKMRDVP
ncbi:MAG TPA: NAD(P)H-binding protein, partial [Actinomycetospora sp.]|nr:NAD(P)H-binding protein [Actinomycetospora sp.]